MSDHQKWKMLHLLHNCAQTEGGRRILTFQELKNAGVHCEGDTWAPLEMAGVILRVGDAYELSAPVQNIIETFTVGRGPKAGVQIKVDYPSVFVIMPFGQFWSKKVFTNLFKKAAEEANFEVVRGDEIVRSGNLNTNLWLEITKAGVIVADVSEPNPHVYYEMGLADALGKPVFVFKQRNVTLLTDFAGIHYHDYDVNKLSTARQILTRQLTELANEKEHKHFGVKALIDR